MDAATENERRPTVDRWNGGTCSRCVDDERRRRQQSRSVFRAESGETEVSIWNLVFFPSLIPLSTLHFFLFPLYPSVSWVSPPLNPARGSDEHCELPKQGSADKRFLMYSWLKKNQAPRDSAVA